MVSSALTTCASMRSVPPSLSSAIPCLRGFRRNIAHDRQPISETQPLERQIVIHHLELARQAYQFVVIRGERVAQRASELRDRILRARRFIRDQRAYAVQRIEEKVRIELSLEET